jgi:uncharacterized phiE125 gp8 family phage protein
MTYPTRMRVERVTAPVIEPISLAQAKLFLRVEHTLEDSLITQFISAAREAAEQIMGKSLITQSQRLYVTGVKDADLCLPRAPVQSIQTIAAEDDSGSRKTLDSSTYRLLSGRNIVQFNALPSANTLIVTYVAGYGDTPETVPNLIRQGILNHVAALYETRESGATMTDVVRAFYPPFREVRL